MKVEIKNKIDEFVNNVKNGIYCSDLIFQTMSTTYRWKNEQKGVITFSGNQVSETHLYEVVKEIERFIC